MPKARVESVQEYIATRPESVRPMLRRLRAAIRKFLPGAERIRP